MTPYVGQLLDIRNALKGEYTVAISERDLREISVLYDSPDDEEVQQTDQTMNAAILTPIAITRQSLGKCIRVSTIDNYQGEEAKVVIISLVRNFSSQKGTIGFLRTSNRINVLLSRAQHGMYILGNKKLLASKSKMWAEVIGMFETKASIGIGMPIHCQNHPANSNIITRSEDFQIMAPGTLFNSS